jgi:hypothetical protein
MYCEAFLNSFYYSILDVDFCSVQLFIIDCAFSVHLSHAVVQAESGLSSSAGQITD